MELHKLFVRTFLLEHDNEHQLKNKKDKTNLEKSKIFDIYSVFSQPELTQKSQRLYQDIRFLPKQIFF